MVSVYGKTEIAKSFITRCLEIFLVPGVTNWRHTSPVSPIDIFCCYCLACRVTVKNYFAGCKHQEISNTHTHIYG